MVEAGILENVSAIFGIHLSGLKPLGRVAGKTGPILAGAGFFEAVIGGKGGHAAVPQHTIDPVLAASNVILSLQHLVSRETDPLDSKVFSVLSICKYNSIICFVHPLFHGTNTSEN